MAAISRAQDVGCAENARHLALLPSN